MDAFKQLYSGFVTAARTLSILPVPGRDAEAMSSSLPWFPAVGALLGAVAYGCALAVMYVFNGSWPEAASLAAIGAGIILTRGFHLDGLSDWADGFGSISDRKRILEIMKDSRVGVFGVLALITVLLGKWIAVVRLLKYGGGLWLVGAYVVSRVAMVELSAALPYARPEGGTAESFVTGAGTAHRLAAILIAAVILLVLFGWKGLLLLGVGWMAGRCFGASCRRRLGGVTGDLLGACSEITEFVSLFFAAALIGGVL